MPDWLRLPHLHADPAEVIWDADGRMLEVQVHCRSVGDPYLPPRCCPCRLW